MNSLKEIKAQILKDPEARAKYAAQKPEFAIAWQLNNRPKVSEAIAPTPEAETRLDG